MYYTAAQFIKEARDMGISKRIGQKPAKVKIGDLFYFVHPHAIRTGNAVFDEEEAPHRAKHSQTSPGIFLTARLTAYHKIIDEDQAKDEKLVKALEDQGITPVVEMDELPPEPIHILITDDTPRGVMVTVPYRATCPACDHQYGYTGANPRYCPECLESRAKREEDAKKQPIKKKTTKRKTKKVK